jgi:hypothetical protein
MNPDHRSSQPAIGSDVLAQYASGDLDVTDTEKTIERRPPRAVWATQEIRPGDILEIIDPRTEGTVLLPRIVARRGRDRDLVALFIATLAAAAMVIVAAVVVGVSR